MQKNYRISKELFKYPYNSRFEVNDDEMFSEKLCSGTIKVRKKIVKAGKLGLVGIQIVFNIITGIAPSQAIGLPILTPSAPMMRSINFNQKLLVMDNRPDKIVFSEKQMDQLYNLAVKWKNKSISKKELITELRGGDIQDWGAAFGIIIAIITVLNNVDAFQVPPHAVVPPHVYPYGWLTGSYNCPKSSSTSTTLQLSKNSACTQASTFVDNNDRIDLVAAYKEVLRRAQSSPDFNCSFERFKALCTEDSKINVGNIREAISALQLEADGVVKNVRRDSSATKKSFDFLIDGGP